MIQLHATITFKSEESFYFILKTPLLQAYFVTLCMTGYVDTFVTAIKSFIEMTQFHAQTEATP